VGEISRAGPHKFSTLSFVTISDREYRLVFSHFSTMTIEEHIIDLSRKYLQLPDSLPLIHFSDESQIMVVDDKRWIWYRRGENNPSAKVSSVKFPRSLMEFGVIGIGYESSLFLVDERSIRNNTSKI
jgi:hypothetical protein